MRLFQKVKELLFPKHQWKTTHVNRWQHPTRQVCNKTGLIREIEAKGLNCRWIYSDGSKDDWCDFGEQDWGGDIMSILIGLVILAVFVSVTYLAGTILLNIIPDSFGPDSKMARIGLGFFVIVVATIALVVLNVTGRIFIEFLWG